MKKVLVLVFVAALASTTLFGQNTIANRIAKSNSEIDIVPTWSGWQYIKPFPLPSALAVGQVVENPGLIVEANQPGGDINVWIKEIDPKTGRETLVKIKARVFGWANWKMLSNPMELLTPMIKLEVVAGGQKIYWAVFEQPETFDRLSLN